MTWLKKTLKVLGYLLLLLIIGIVIYCALNWTLVSNMVNMTNRENMRTDNVRDWETVVTAIPGSSDDSLLITSETSNLSAEQIDKMLAYHQQTDGLSLVVWQNGSIQLEHYDENMSRSSVTASFSMNKSITGLVAAVLHSENVLSLDDPIAAVMDDWKDDVRGQMTLRELLHHTTPLKVVSMSKPNLRSLEILIGDDIEKAAMGTPVDDEELVFDYATINYQIAGAVIRRHIKQAYNQTYAEYLSEKIWQPIGAGNAWLSSGKPDGIPRFYAGMQASAADWLKIGLLIKDQGKVNGVQVIPSQAINTLTTPAASNPLYGLGVWLDSPEDGGREYGPSTKFSVTHSAPYLADDVIFFDGFGGQRVYIVPSADLVIVRTGQVSFAFDDSILVNLVLDKT